MTDSGKDNTVEYESDSNSMQASKKCANWLKKQLPIIVERGFIGEETAEEIRSVPTASDRNRWSGILLTIPGVFGVLLTG